jgi:Fe2+ or Zn2+ uptake regulation protein
MEDCYHGNLLVGKNHFNYKSDFIYICADCGQIFEYEDAKEIIIRNRMEEMNQSSVE